jgi:hypothetical protein
MLEVVSIYKLDDYYNYRLTTVLIWRLFPPSATNDAPCRGDTLYSDTVHFFYIGSNGSKRLSADCLQGEISGMYSRKIYVIARLFLSNSDYVVLNEGVIRE